MHCFWGEEEEVCTKKGSLNTQGKDASVPGKDAETKTCRIQEGKN